MSNSSVVDSAMVCIRRVLSGLLFVLAISISNVAMAEYELIFYAGNGDLKMVKVLLDKGADVDKMWVDRPKKGPKKSRWDHHPFASCNVDKIGTVQTKNILNQTSTFVGMLMVIKTG